MYYPTLPKIMLTKSVKKLITVNRKKCLPQVERTPYRGWKRVLTVPEKKVLDFCKQTVRPPISRLLSLKKGGRTVTLSLRQFHQFIHDCLHRLITVCKASPLCSCVEFDCRLCPGRAHQKPRIIVQTIIQHI